MFRWTPDGKSFGKGPIWGIAQTGQNVVAFYNKKKLAPAGLQPEQDAADVRGLRADARHAAGEAPDDEPVIEAGNKEGYGFIHLFGGIWGAYVNAAGRPQLDLPRARLALRHAGHDQGAREAPAVGARPATSTTTTTRSATTPRPASSPRARARSGSAATGTRRSSRRVSAPANVGVMPIPPGPSGKWTSIGGLSGPWHISAKTKYPDLGRRVAQLRDHLAAQAKELMFAQQQLPADRRAKPPAGDPYLASGAQGVHSSSRTTTGSCSTPTGPRRRCTRRCRTSTSSCSPGARRRPDMAKAVQADWAKFDKTLR